MYIPIHVCRLLTVAEVCQQEKKNIAAPEYQRESASTSFLKKRRSQMCSLSRIKNSNIDIIHLLYTTRPSSFVHSLLLYKLCSLPKEGKICIFVSKQVAIQLYWVRVGNISV